MGGSLGKWSVRRRGTQGTRKGPNPAPSHPCLYNKSGMVVGTQGTRKGPDPPPIHLCLYT